MDEGHREVRALLEAGGLSEFWPGLAALGGTALPFLSVLEPQDLLGLGMSSVQAQQLLGAVAAAAAAPPRALSSQDGPAAPPRPSRRPLRADDLSFGELSALLRRENELRLAPATQAAYRAAEADGPQQAHGDWMEVTEQLQRAVVRGALSPAAPQGELERGLARLRGAPHERHWSAEQSAELASISLWRRFNRARDGALREGYAFPDVALSPLGGGACRPLTTFGQGGAGRPLVVVAGSYS